jgi:steroid delta-isomerase-like uncharacterized protein
VSELSTAKEAKVIHRWFEEIWNQGRFETVRELLAPDGPLHGLGEHGVVAVGPAGFQPYFQRLRGAFPDMHCTVVQTVTEGEWVAARFTVTMTHRGDQLGIPATGKKASITGMCFARIRDGRIVEGHNNWDQSGLLQQLGQPPVATLMK